MRINILITITTAALFAYGCGSGGRNTSTNANGRPSSDHAAMDHSSMDHNTMDHGSTGHTMQSSPNAAAAPYDLQFLDTMIHHHQGAIDMAIAAERKAQHDEIRSLAKDIVSSQKQEIAQMTEWREKWFPGAAPALNMQMAGMGDSMKGMDMRKLDQLSGNDFDLEFIKQMTPHHEGAVIMAREALQRSTKPEIKTLANAIINAQEKEITEMKAWAGKWSRPGR